MCGQQRRTYYRPFTSCLRRGRDHHRAGTIQCWTGDPGRRRRKAGGLAGRSRGSTGPWSISVNTSASRVVSPTGPRGEAAAGSPTARRRRGPAPSLTITPVVLSSERLIEIRVVIGFLGRRSIPALHQKSTPSCWALMGTRPLDTHTCDSREYPGPAGYEPTDPALRARVARHFRSRGSARSISLQGL